MEKLKVFVIVILFTSCNRVTELPIVRTGTSNSTNSSVVGVGEVVSTGGDKNVIRGFYYWKVGDLPSWSPYNRVVHEDGGSGEYTIDMTSLLQADKAYFYCAFAENKMGESRGETKALVANPKNAIVNSRGCIECDSYNVGEYFYLDDKVMLVVDEDLLYDKMYWDNVDLSTVCTSKLQQLNHLGGESSEYLNGDITKWDVSNVYDMSFCFSRFWGSGLTFNQPIGNWDVSNVIYMEGMFGHVKGFNQNLQNWDVSNVSDMSGMFYDCPSVPKGIGNWDVRNVTDMNSMFKYATGFNQDIGNWDVSNVTYMESMFEDASNFNQNIGNWDVSNVTNMSYMFDDATNFNQNLSNWCVSNFSFEPYMFSTGSSLTASNHPVWGTCP